MSWTDNQLLAIDIRDRNLLVSAAAGSGKTAVLVERVIKMVTNEQNPVDIDKLLIVTFTNAAAAGMRERIAAAITNLLGTQPENQYLTEQLARLDNASICTVHSFCQSLIRANFFKLGISASFTIAEQHDLLQFKRFAIDEVFTQYYENGEVAFSMLCDCYGGKKSNDNLQNLVMRLYDFTQSLHNPDEWLSQCVEMYSSAGIDMWQQAILRHCRNLLDNACQYLDAAIAFAEQDPAQGKRTDLLHEEYTFMQVLKNHGWDALHSIVANYKFEPIPRKSKTMDEYLAAKVKAYRDAAKDIFASISGIIDGSTYDFINECAEQRPMIQCLTQLVRDYAQLYKEQKSERNCLDFNDLEHYTLTLLREESFADSIKSEFHEILVDEYQDTNGIQAKIFQYLSNGSNLFVVGDVKQSIYRFRHAEPQFFIEKSKLYESDETAGAVVKLAHNFRSRAGVLEVINKIFLCLMSENAGEVDYAGQQLICGSGGEVDTHDVEVYIIDKDSGGENEIDLASIQLEAKFTADTILTYVNNKQFKLTDKHTGELRAAKYSDIAILTHNKNSGAAFAQAFAAVGIPYTTIAESGFLQRNECRIMLSLLEVLDNPLQDVPLVAIMRSAMFMFGDDELIQIREKNKYAFYHAVMAMADEGCSKCKALLEKLNTYKQLCVTHGIAFTLRQCVRETGFMSYAAMLPGDRVKEINRFCELAATFEQNEYKSVYAFVNHVKNLIENGSDDSAIVSGSADDMVTITTIHRSKGLEYPIVFLMDTSHKFNLTDINNSVVFHNKCGIGADFIDVRRMIKYPTVAKTAVRLAQTKEMLSEELRVLYVALTRAVSKLIIVGSVSNYSGRRDKWEEGAEVMQQFADSSEFVLRQRCYLDLIMPALIRQGLSGLIKLRAASEVLATDIKMVDIIQHDEEAIDQKEIEARLSYTYPHYAATKIPSKVSVSEILADELEINIPMRSFNAAKTINAATRGSVTHAFMQVLDLANVATEDCIKSQLASMLQSGAITEECAELIDTAAVAEFMQSPLAQRMCAAQMIRREYKFVVDIAAAHFGNKSFADSCGDETLLLQGVIDCFFEEADGIVVLDYKTGSQNAESENYVKQLELYAYALEKLLGKTVKERHIVKLL